MLSLFTNFNKSRTAFSCYLLLACILSCKKLVQISPPVSSITTTEVFSDSADAASAILGVYSNMAYNGIGSDGNFANAGATTYYGLSADELLKFAPDPQTSNMITNTVLADNPNTSYTWQVAFQYLYQVNAILEGISSPSRIKQAVKNEFTGEAKFLRAFLNFYLVNIYGEIPLITSTDYQSNAVAFRKPVSEVYQSIRNDLLDAQDLLPADYSAGGGEKTRGNQWAATALLARVYLYQKNWGGADSASSIIINSGQFSLNFDLNSVFLKNNTEAILQWENNSTVNTVTFNGTSEGYVFIPLDSSSPPHYYLTDPLLTAFEAGDQRRTAWVKTYTYTGDGHNYSYPFKYKLGNYQTAANAPVAEYYTVLRLAEQYLIRAEAKAQLNKLSEAIMDLNTIRNRASLPPLSPLLNQSQLLAAVAQERRIELFAEWGHRWLDLKRTDQVAAAFQNISYKAAYKPYQQLYPIPLTEISTDINLTENPGY